MNEKQREKEWQRLERILFELIKMDDYSRGVGKSMLLLQNASQIAKAGKRALVIASDSRHARHMQDQFNQMFKKQLTLDQTRNIFFTNLLDLSEDSKGLHDVVPLIDNFSCTSLAREILALRDAEAYVKGKRTRG